MARHRRHRNVRIAEALRRRFGQRHETLAHQRRRRMPALSAATLARNTAAVQLPQQPMPETTASARVRAVSAAAPRPRRARRCRGCCRTDPSAGISRRDNATAGFARAARTPRCRGTRSPRSRRWSCFERIEPFRQRLDLGLARTARPQRGVGNDLIVRHAYSSASCKRLRLWSDG